MEANIISLIVGAVITFVTTIVTVIITNILQNSREIKTRNWQIEDIKRVERSMLAKKRVENIEVLLKRIVEFGRECIKIEKEILSEYKKNLGDKKLSKYFQLMHKESIKSSQVSKKTKNTMVAFSENDIEFIEIWKEFVKRQNDRVDRMSLDSTKILEDLHEIYAVKSGNVAHDLDKFSAYVFRESFECIRLGRSANKGEEINIEDEEERITKFEKEVIVKYGEILLVLESYIID